MKARNNPFRTDRVLSVRYRECGETLDGLLDRLRDLGYRGAIVGSHGTGKTTLLEHLEPGLVRLGFSIKRLRLDDRARSFPRGFTRRFCAVLTERDFILLDGAEQMRFFEWQWFKLCSKKAGGLLITTHKEGMLPTLKKCTTTPELLDDIITELVGPQGRRVAAITEELLTRHGGNVRGALREMYDVYAGKES